nr:hypothetical protein [Streptomyces virginiae]
METFGLLRRGRLIYSALTGRSRVLSDEFELSLLDECQTHYGDYSRDREKVVNTRTKLLRESLAFHLKNNAAYARYAASMGVHDDSVPISQIPLIPSSLFKRTDVSLASIPEREVEKFCTSSGTSGSISVVPRDEPTLLRFLGSISSSISDLFGIERAGNYRAIVLGPTADQAGDLWFSYVCSSLSIMLCTEYFEHDGVFQATQAARRVLELLNQENDVIVLGPPALMLEMAEEYYNLHSTAPSFPAKSFLVTAGGWKGRQAENIAPVDFRSKVQHLMNVVHPSQIRDSYNMVELNSVLHECEEHEKHVPPWLMVQARDPKLGTPLQNSDVVGILAFLDPSATSYPGFILSDDFGTVEESPCPCGRVTERVRISRRISRIEARGCALKMSSTEASKANSAGRDRIFTSIYRNPSGVSVPARESS